MQPSRFLSNEVDLSPICMAGHSLGEYTALVAAKSLNYFEAVKLVRKEGRINAISGAKWFWSNGGYTWA